MLSTAAAVSALSPCAAADLTGAVVVAWAPDEHGASALAWALAEARRDGRPVVVANASRGDAYVDDRYAVDDQLADLDRVLAGSGVVHEIRQDVVADVADYVLEIAESVAASRIVVGLRRRSPVGKLLMGSAAQRILLGAACPVLAVKAGSRPD